MDELRNSKLYHKKDTKSILLESFKYTTPIILTYILMGFVFGVMLANAGYSPWISLLMSVVIYAGAMQFVALSLLASGALPLEVIIISLGINARQFFYAIASLKRYNFSGFKKWYLVFSVTDETFALLNLREQNLKDSIESNKDFIQDNQKIMFYISLFNQIYWIFGCVLGSILGGAIAFLGRIQGLEFIVIATFSILLFESIKHKENLFSIFIGIICTLFCLFLSKEFFLLYSLLLIFMILSLQIFFGRKI